MFGGGCGSALFVVKLGSLVSLDGFDPLPFRPH
jgi:hypothetical protein